MQFVENGVATAVVPFSNTASMTLSAVDGVKTVTGKFWDIAGNPLSDSQDSIILDTTLAVASFSATGASTQGNTLTLALDIQETGANVVASLPGLFNGLQLFDNGAAGDTAPNDGVYGRSITINKPIELTEFVSADIVDRAGNNLTKNSDAPVVLSTPPTISALKVVSNVATGSMKLTFSTNEPTTSFVEYGLSALDKPNYADVSSALSTTHSVTITGLPANTMSYFTISAKDAAGNATIVNSQGKLAPPTPDNFSAHAGDAEIGVIWSAVTTEGMSGYNLYRSEGTGAYIRLNGSMPITQTYYLDALVVNDIVYSYKVASIDSDGNESIQSASVTATPAAVNAGPTAVNGGLIDTNTVWLSSKSPYQISAPTKVKEGAKLLMLPGTSVEFVVADQYLLVDGQLEAQGTETKPVVITAFNFDPNDFYNASSGSIRFAINNNQPQFIKNGVLNNVAVYRTYTNNWDRQSNPTKIVLENSEVNLGYKEFYIQQALNTVFKVYFEQYYSQFRIVNVVDSELSAVDRQGNLRTITANNENLEVNAMSGSKLNYVGIRQANSISNSEILGSRLGNISTIKNSVLTDTQLTNDGRLVATSNILVNTKFVLNYDSNRLYMRFNRLDSLSTVSASHLDISHNWWGTVDLDDIAARTGYSSSQERQTHLYPIISSNDIYLADNDGDGLFDYQDYDNDNDGYSDLQEDWASDPLFGSIYNPLDAASKPATVKDNDMDGEPDASDIDDDNDGITDDNEMVRGTNPYLADSDGDGIDDGLEVSVKYDPLNANNYPLSGNIANIRIDSSNVSSDGWVYITGGTQAAELDSGTYLTNVTVAPGTKLMLDRDAYINFNDASMIGTDSLPIQIQSTGSGQSLSINASQLAYVVYSSAKSVQIDSRTSIEHSDMTGGGNIYGTIKNSVIMGALNVRQSQVQGSYIKTNGSVTNTDVTSSFATPGYTESIIAKNSVFPAIFAARSSQFNNSWVYSIHYGYTFNRFTDTDIGIANYGPGEWNHFFDGSYLGFDSGLGEPIDQLGDGIANTVLTDPATSNTYTVDGVTNPRSTPIFNLTDPKPWQIIGGLWDPTDVGVWWDMNDPDTFQASDPQKNLGRISGQVLLEGHVDHSGVAVSIINTGLTAVTDTDGTWEIMAPAKSYPSGIRYTKDHFGTQTKSRSYEIVSGGSLDLGVINLEQTSGRIFGVLVVDDALNVTPAVITATSINNSYTLNPSASGAFELASIPVGDYSLSFSFAGGSWETRVRSVDMVAGQTEYDLGIVQLKNSFVYVNADAAYTNSNGVTLSLDNAQAVTMSITEGGVSSGVIAFSNSHSLTLSPGDGIKTVTVNYFDAGGAALTPAADTIELDTTVVLSSLSLSAVSTMGDTLLVILDAQEAGGTATASASGLFSNLTLNDNGLGADSAANDGLYSANFVIDTAEDFALLPVVANFTDKAGNVDSLTSVATLTLITSPTVSNLYAKTVGGELVITFSTNEMTTSQVCWSSASVGLTCVPVSSIDSLDHQISLVVPDGETISFDIKVNDAVTTEVVESDASQLSLAPVMSISGEAGYSETGITWAAETAATGYRVYRSDDSNHFTAVADVPANKNYFVDDTVANDTTYYYRVVWLDALGKESDRSKMVTLTPSVSRAGPTEMDGGVLSVNTIWLASRSPYQIVNNLMIKEAATLNLMAGTDVEFIGSAKHIYVKGKIMAYGSALAPVTIASDFAFTQPSTHSTLLYDINNTQVSVLDHTHLTDVKVHKDFSSSYDWGYYPTPVDVTNGLLNYYVESYEYIGFAIRSIVDSVVNIDNCGEIGNQSNPGYSKLVITNITLTTIKRTNNTSACPYGYAAIYSDSVSNSAISNLGIALGSSMTNSSLTNAYVGDNSGTWSLSDLNVTNSDLYLEGDTSRLTMSRSIIDAVSTVKAAQLDVGKNYWGTTDIADIGLRTGYVADKLLNTHLYPVISSADLENADFDGDGIPDIRDHDNDNDGYSDLQEDWLSDPAYGSVYDPMDNNSYPVDPVDNDMDGVTDDLDLDDDNDTISDLDEATYGTSPYLADTDGDGVNDNVEIAAKYDPLDYLHKPLVGNVSGVHIDANYHNADGAVYILGNTSLTNVTAEPGTLLMIDRDASVSFYNSQLTGNATAPIFMRATGAGSGGVNFVGVTASYMNIKLPINFYLYENSVFNRSDLKLNDNWNIDSTSALQNSDFVVDSNGENYGRIHHSRVSGTSYFNNRGEITASSINTAGELYNNNGSVSDSWVSWLENRSGGLVMGSVAERYVSSDTYISTVIDSDVQMNCCSGTWATLFSGSHIMSSDGLSFYDGLGTPEDQVGDGVADTVFTVGVDTYTVDGIRAPRSTKNFPNGEADLWDPTGVGALWDPLNPTLFPEP